MIGILIISSLVACSYGASFPHHRVVGGHNATIEDHPYQVALEQNGELLCGGSLIARKWILTAAHCIHDENKITVKVGSVMWDEGGVDHVVQKRFIHPLWKKPGIKRHDYDFALLELDFPVELNERVQLIKLSEEGAELEVGTLFTITGWGDTAGWDGVGPSKFLQVVQVPLVSREICDQVYPDKVTDRMFCASFHGEGGRDSCQGDSGGPVVHDRIQYGVVSWATECGLKFYPGVNAKVSSVRSWIREVSGV